MKKLLSLLSAAGIAYEIGLTNAMSEECNSGIKNSNFMINVGYTFYSR